MEGTEKTHMNKQKSIMNNWNYHANIILTSLPASEFQI